VGKALIIHTGPHISIVTVAHLVAQLTIVRIDPNFRNRTRRVGYRTARLMRYGIVTSTVDGRSRRDDIVSRLVVKVAGTTLAAGRFLGSRQLARVGVRIVIGKGGRLVGTLINRMVGIEAIPNVQPSFGTLSAIVGTHDLMRDGLIVTRRQVRIGGVIVAAASAFAVLGDLRGSNPGFVDSTVGGFHMTVKDA